MWRQQTAELDEDIQIEDMGVEHAEVSTHKLQPSAKPKADLRIVVLGGDAVDNSYACSTILRYRQLEETINPLKGNAIERTVGGRQVSVFRAPSYWMEHLASDKIFSNGLESIRHEVQNCTSTLFPGPHAFLLVMRAGRASGKEYYLLRALTSVFGAEALEYTMVIFIHVHEWDHPTRALKERCVQMCGERFHVLEKSDENVEELLREIETRTNKKTSRFFIQRSYEDIMKTCFESWESSRLHAQQRRERKLIEEMKAEHELKETVLKKRLETLELHANDLRKELETSRHSEIAFEKHLEEFRLSESGLRKDLEGSRLSESALRKDLEGSRLSESVLRKDLEGSRLSESALKKHLEESRLSENTLKKHLEESRLSESALRKDLEESRLSESALRKDLEESRLSESALRKDLEESRLSESALKKHLEESRLSESTLRKDLEESRLSENTLKKHLEESRLSENTLKKHLEESRLSESGLRKDLEESRLFLSKELNKWNDRSHQFRREAAERETELQKKLKDLQAQVELLKLEKEKRQLDYRERELTARERDLENKVRERRQDTAVRRSEEETAESFQTGDIKPARCDSIKLPPHM